MRNSLLLFLAVVMAAGICFAQTESATVSGRVLDKSAAAVVGAEVVLTNVDTGAQNQTKTGKEGLYVFTGVTPGRYRLAAGAAGFSVTVKNDLIVHVQDELAENFTLQVGSVNEVVTVSASAINVNTTDASVSTVVDQTYVKNMPLNGRSFQDLILLTPGVVTATPQLSGSSFPGGIGQSGEFSVNGQRTEENYYTVNGVSANVGAAPGSLMTGFAGASGSVAASTALGTTQALVSVDELQEFRVQSSTYSAEYGRNPGAQISFETKSGANLFHGTAYDYLRNDVFDATDYFTNYLRPLNPSLVKGALRQNDFGGTLGGPVIKNKTFFFASYEGLRLVQPQPAATMVVPDSTVRASTVAPLNQALNAFPQPNGGELLQPCNSPTDPTCNPATGLEPSGAAAYIASWSNRSTLNSTSVRFDHIVNDKTRLFFRFNNTGSDSAALQGLQTGSAAPSVNTISSYTIRTYTGGATSLFSSRLSNEFRLNYTSNSATAKSSVEKVGGNTPVDMQQLSGLGPQSSPDINFFFGPYFLQIFANNSAATQRQWNLVDTVSYSRGRHQLKFGTDYRRLTPFTVPTNPNVFWGYFDVPSTESNSPFDLISVVNAAYPLFTNFSLFANDEWKVTSRLNLSLGLRWDVNPAAGVTQGLSPYSLDFVGSPATWTLSSRGAPLWKTTWYNFAPRLGVAYTLRDAAGWETVVRAGGGLFFDSGQQVGASSFTGAGYVGQTFSFAPFPNVPIPSVSTQGPFNSLFGFAPHLQLPYTLQWNGSVEQSLGKSQALTVTYLGSHASRLLQTTTFPNGGNKLLTSFGQFLKVENGQTAHYDAMQIQFQRRLSQGLTVLASHTWSHCIDYGSINFNFGYDRGNCDFDVRQNFSGAFSYDVPTLARGGITRALLGHWGIDDRFMARTAFPVDLLGNQVFDPVTEKRLSNGLDFVPGQPIYIYGAQCANVYAVDFGNTLACPGGRAINPNAFTSVSSGLGNVPRNFARGFGAWQMNVAVRREFPIYENLKLQFRAEAFNVFNHPNLGLINNNLGQNTFGQAQFTLANSLGVLNPLYQMGGARSMQFALKLVF